MESLKKGYIFIKLAWKDARDRPALLAPSWYTVLVGLLLTAILLGLIVLIALRLGNNLLGPLLVGLLSVLLAFGLFVTASIFSLMTSCLYFQKLEGSEASLAPAWASLQRSASDVVLVASASLGISLGQWQAQRTPLGSPPEKAWQDAAYLVTPTLAIETVSLAVGLQRVAGIVQGHLLRIGAGVVGVATLSRLGGLLLGLIGVVLGVGLNRLFTIPGPAAGLSIAGALTGLLVASLLILIGISAGTYTTTVYHTCLYQLARLSEDARQEGQPAAAGIPASNPLAVVLSEPN